MPFLLKTLALASTLLSSTALAAPYASPPHDMLAERAAVVSCPASNQTTYTTGSSSFIIECGMDRVGGDLTWVYAPTFAQCLQSCSTTAKCIDVSWVSNIGFCYMKSASLAPTFSSNIWGARLLSPSVSTTSTTSKASFTTSTTSKASTATTSLSSKTSTTASATTSTTAASVVAKRGAPYNSVAYIAPLSNHPKVNWAYNWDSAPNGTVPSGFEYLPMLWSNASVLTAPWQANVAAALASGSRHLLSFNEPDSSAQSNMSPAVAAAAYKQWMQPYATQAKLGSPSITNGVAPMGITWLGQFMANCTACTIDFVPVHWYSSATSFADLQNYIQSAYAQAGKPLWLTEFGVSGTDAQVTAFLQQALPWLDSLSYVERYAYFWAAPGFLINSAGNGLSTYGQTYATL